MLGVSSTWFFEMLAGSSERPLRRFRLEFMCCGMGCQLAALCDHVDCISAHNDAAQQSDVSLSKKTSARDSPSSRSNLAIPTFVLFPAIFKQWGTTNSIALRSIT
jgi:hypothetical protein